MLVRYKSLIGSILITIFGKCSCNLQWQNYFQLKFSDRIWVIKQTPFGRYVH